MAIGNQVEDFLARIFSGYNPRRVRDSKVIHDTLWGTNRFYPHEIAVIDTPLIQRLRQIHQTGLSFLAYPSVNHTRFEHSLGIATIVTKFVQKLKEKHPTGIPGVGEWNDSPTSPMMAELRMAALLHDCGHGFFSHLTENIYRWHQDIAELKTRPDLTHAKPSELLSYLIVKSNFFKRFFSEQVSSYGVEINLDRVADLIIGKSDQERLFLASIVNGPMDADKIDYISRDTFFSGVSTTIDVDRLLNELSVHTFKNGLNALVVSSPLPLERLLFSKVLLYTTLYHHQKVLAADSMVSGMLEYVQRPDTPPLNGRKFTEVIDFLSFTDYEILRMNREHGENEFVNKILRDLSCRNLWRRCLVISRETVDNYDSHASYLINRLSQSPTEMLKLREAIYERMSGRGQLSIHELWVAVPEQPSLREATQTLALLPGDREPVKLNDIFPLDGWLRAFSDNKWKGYVFGPSKLQKEISGAAAEVLEDYGLRLNKKSVAYARVS